MRVAVTGGIADGKSTVCEILRDLGHSVVSADEIARQLLDDPEVINEIIENIGGTFVQSGRVDRDALRKAISADPELRKT
jgi:dephospho-CoA kinase